MQSSAAGWRSALHNMDTLLKNISAVYKRIAHAAMRAGRDPHDVTLVAVTKTVSADMIRHAMDAGLRVFGENRVQEAQRKVTSDELRVTSSIPPVVKGITPPAPPLGKGGMGGGVDWHLIGHLQRNKAKYAVQLFNLIHS